MTMQEEAHIIRMIRERAVCYFHFMEDETLDIEDKLCEFQNYRMSASEVICRKIRNNIGLTPEEIEFYKEHPSCRERLKKGWRVMNWWNPLY